MGDSTTEGSVDIISSFSASMFEWIQADVLPVLYCVVTISYILVVYLLYGILIQSIRVNDRMSQPFYALILHVGCMDIIYATILMILGVIHSFLDQWKLSNYGCYVTAILFNIVFYMTFCYCFWQGLERTLCVASKKKWEIFFMENNGRWYKLCIAFNWVAVAGICLLPIPEFGIADIQYYSSGYQCDYFPSNKGFLYAYFCLAYFIPFLIYMVYLFIIVHVRRKQMREFVPDEAELLTGGLVSARRSSKKVVSFREPKEKSVVSVTHGEQNTAKRQGSLPPINNSNNSNNMVENSQMPDVENCNNSNNLDVEAGPPATYSSPLPPEIEGSEEPATYDSPPPPRRGAGGAVGGAAAATTKKVTMTEQVSTKKSTKAPSETIEGHDNSVPPLNLPTETRRQSRMVVARKTYSSVFEEHIDFHHAMSYGIVWILVYLLWVPYCATMIAQANAGHDTTIWSGWYPLAIIIANLSFCLKAIVYISHNKDIRADIKNIFSAKVLETARAWQEKVDRSLNTANNALFTAPKPSERGMKAVADAKMAMMRWKEKLTSRKDKNQVNTENDKAHLSATNNRAMGSDGGRMKSTQL